MSSIDDMQLNSDEQESKLKEIQEAKAFLRERYLYLLSTMCEDKTCKIKMYEGTKVEVKVKAFDLNFENIIVKDLKTPSQQNFQTAILRTGDIQTISFT